MNSCGRRTEGRTHKRIKVFKLIGPSTASEGIKKFMPRENKVHPLNKENSAKGVKICQNIK